MATHRLFDNFCPIRSDGELGVLQQPSGELFHWWSHGSAHLKEQEGGVSLQGDGVPSAAQQWPGGLAYLAAITPVDHGDPLLSSQRVDVDLVGVPTAVALLLGLGELRQQQVLVLLCWEDRQSEAG